MYSKPSNHNIWPRSFSGTFTCYEVKSWPNAAIWRSRMHLFALILLFHNSTTLNYIRTNWVRATNTQKSISSLILKVWVKIAFPLPLQRQK